MIQNMMSKFYVDSEEAYPYEPEHLLLEAILERAIRDGFGCKGMTSEMVQHARSWLHDKDPRPWSFVWICKNLDLSDRFRNRILRTIPLSIEQRIARPCNGSVMLVSNTDLASDPSHTQFAVRKEFLSGYNRQVRRQKPSKRSSSHLHVVRPSKKSLPEFVDF